jgi:deoxyribodipyrimidine photo-lyase
MTEAPIPPPLDLPVVVAAVPDMPALLLVTPEDLHPESGFGPMSGFAGVLVVSGAATGGDRSRAFVAGAAADAATRAGANFNCPVQMIDAIDPEILNAAAASASVDTIITPYAPVGPVADALAAATATLARSDIALVQKRRSWDAQFWPHARKGFFAFKEKIPAILAQEGLC